MLASKTIVIGYCDHTASEIGGLIEAGKANQLLGLRGEYTIVYTRDDIVVVVTSYIGAMQYCYYYDGKTFSHGKTIIEIIREVGLHWDWDWRSVGDLCELENLTESRTLHKHIKKVPPGSILRFDKKLSIHSKRLIDTIKTADNGDPVQAVEIFNDETKFWASEKPYLSLSGGFDSRCILSSMLKQDIFPTVVTLGEETSSDISVAKKIARCFGLEHIIVNLNIDELIQNGERIATITNGSKPARHWHTHLYPRKACVPVDQSFYVGTLGEFARSYYFDKGVAGILLDTWGEKAQRMYWRSKLIKHRTFKEQELKYLSPELEKEVSPEGIELKATQNAELSRGEFLAGGTRYYLEQRVPNFYANGISMYNDTTQWRSPFHRIDWLKQIWNISDNWKLGSNWHRLAIKRNFPMLLNFSEEKGFMQDRMLSKAPPFYWTEAMQRVKYKTYDLSGGWYRDKKIREIILDNLDCLDDICQKPLPEKILDDHVRDGNRVKAISFLLTIVNFKKALRNG
jgi:hypothetical protein